MLLAFTLSWSAFIGLRALGVPFAIRVSMGMFGPAVAATTVRLVRREGFADSGIGLRADWRGYLLALGLAPALVAAGVLVSSGLGIQHFDVARNLHLLGEQLVVRVYQHGGVLPPGATGDSLARQTAVSSLVLAVTIAPIINAVFAMGEEYGWRGYLLPRLEPFGPLRAAVLVGVVWGFWHAPVIALDRFNYPDHRYLGVPFFVAYTVPMGIILAWLRYRFVSVWPVAVAHGAVNAWASFSPLLLSRGDSLLGAPTGLSSILPAALLAAALIATGRLARPRAIVGNSNQA